MITHNEIYTKCNIIISNNFRISRQAISRLLNEDFTFANYLSRRFVVTHLSDFSNFYVNFDIRLTSRGCEGLLPNKSLIRNINFFVAEKVLESYILDLGPSLIVDSAPLGPSLIVDSAALEVKNSLKTPFLIKMQESITTVKNIKNLNYYNIFIEFFKKLYYGKSYSDLNKPYLSYEYYIKKYPIKPQILNKTSFCHVILNENLISKKDFILKEDVNLLKTTSNLNNTNINKTLITTTLVSIIFWGAYIHLKNKIS